MPILTPIRSFLAAAKKIEPGDTWGVQLPLYGTVYAPGTCKVYLFFAVVKYTQFSIIAQDKMYIIF
jgi:hypothetical protein